MKTQALALALLTAAVSSMSAQMMDPQMEQQAPAKAGQQPQQEEMAPPPDAAQQKAAHAFDAKKGMVAKPAPPPTVKPAALTSLTPREKVVQLLDRFTYGPRPGEVDRVMAMGEDKWLTQQFAPDAIPDNALNRRLADYLTVNMSAADAIALFPDRPQIASVAQGKTPYPSDPLQNAVFEVQVYRWNLEQDVKKPDGSGQPRPQPSDEEIAAKKAADKATALRIAGELYAMPKDKRMAALIAMPVEDRIAFAQNNNINIPDPQRYQLMNDFTPREKATIYAMAGNINSAYNIGNELAQARMLRDVLSERQMQQVMTEFWFNHFNVYLPKDSDSWYTTSYERDVIRKNALGNFKDLLLATATSPAMMVYLDNYLSIGPDSIADGVDPRKPNSKKQNKGLNENYGREVMELHTVGVNGGYSQADVTALSAILTGWGVDRANQGGGFMFDPNRHEPGPKVWFGYKIDDDGTVTKLPAGYVQQGPTFGPSDTIANANSVKQGIAALTLLANAPQTAHFISYMMAQYFLADNPPASVVDRMQKAFLDSKGDIKTVLRALITSPEFNSKQYFRNKVKTPEEFVASAFRSTSTDPQNPGAMVNQVRTMGMEMYHKLEPTGYYLTADKWMSSNALVDRLNFAYSLTNSKFSNQKFDSPRVLALGLMTPSSGSDFSGLGGPRPAAGTASMDPTAAHLLGVAATAKTTDTPTPTPVLMPGAEVAMRVLEATMIGAPVSTQTNQLINKQLQQQPVNANPTDTLNLLTALVMGSPEFQLR